MKGAPVEVVEVKPPRNAGPVAAIESGGHQRRCLCYCEFPSPVSLPSFHYYARPVSLPVLSQRSCSWTHDLSFAARRHGVVSQPARRATVTRWRSGPPAGTPVPPYHRSRVAASQPSRRGAATRWVPLSFAAACRPVSAPVQVQRPAARSLSLCRAWPVSLPALAQRPAGSPFPSSW